MHKNNKLINKLNSINSISLAALLLLSGCGATGDGPDGTMSGEQAKPAVKLIATGDVDNDGVLNAEDKCNDTLPNTWIDLKGCDLDTDGDKIADSRDVCRGTPRGIKVDGRGCGFDDDHDGVPNYRDRCSKTIDNVGVDGSGCEWDGDNDGVVDSKDLCAGTPPGVKVEFMGCHIIEVVTLKGVNFTTGSDVLSENARTILKRVAKNLRKHPRMRVEVAGHTDNTGSAAVNSQLSLQRARAATHYLVDMGISKKVLSTHGYASKQPVSSNDTADGRSRNRRVEMRFVEID